MNEATLCFLVRDGEILLAKHKREIGKDKWNGYGGKFTGGETVRAAAIREVLQESGVYIPNHSNLEKMGSILFHNGNKKAWKVHVFIAKTWEGNPKESDEMGEPRWFKFEEIPFNEMFSSDREWLPLILKGERVHWEVFYTENFVVERINRNPN